jgi:hypothetical protein
MKHLPRTRARVLLIAAAVAVSACSSHPELDPRELQSAENAILEAKQLGAEQLAGQVLREAEERLLLARARSDAGREDEALRMLHEARVLAERAAAESLARQTVQAAEVLQQSLSTLEQTLGADAPDAE